MEETIEFTMKFPSSTLASSGSSYGATGPAYINVDGTEGYLRLEKAYFYEGMSYSGQTTKGPISGTSPGKAPFQFTAEADHFADCVRNNTQPNTAGEEGLADMIAIEAIYRAAGAPIA